MFFTRRRRSQVAQRSGDAATYRPAAYVSLASRDGRAALLDLRAGRYYLLNEVGTRMWELLVRGCNVPAMVDRLADEFDAGRDTLAKDANAFVSDLESKHLVERA
jgi:hypothetical protein